MITFGDQKIDFHGIYDESDDFDAPPGTLKSGSVNWMKTGRGSLKARGAFVADVAYPSQLNLQADFSLTSDTYSGTNSNLTFVKPLYVVYFKTVKPSEKMIRFMVGLFSFNNGSTTVYMKRYLMYPYYNSGWQNHWKDVTPYLIDEVKTSPSITEHTTTTFTAVIDTPSNGGYLSADLPGGFVYVEDGVIGDASNVFGSVAADTMHLAEGDDVIISADTSFVSPNSLKFKTGTAHSVWDNGVDTFRYHKNLCDGSGRIPYKDLCSTTSSLFDGYTFTHVIRNGAVFLYENAGDTGYPSLQWQFGYENRTLFGTGNIWSRADYIYNDHDWLYDKHLVIGFPGYAKITTGEANWLNGKTVLRWATGVAPSSVPAGSGSATMGSGGWDRYTGKLILGTGFAAGDLTKNLYKIEDVDLSVDVEGFMMTELDVHGRFGAYRSFADHTTVMSGFGKFETSVNAKIYGWVEFDSSSVLADDGLEADAGEFPFQPSLGFVGEVVVENGGAGYTASTTFPVDFVGGTPRSPDVVVAKAEHYRDRPDTIFDESQLVLKEERRRHESGEQYGNALAVAQSDAGGAITGVTILNSGDTYTETPTAKVSGAYTTEAELRVRVFKKNLAILVGFCMEHGNRYGLHRTSIHTLHNAIGSPVLTSSVKNYGVLSVIELIPWVFNRSATGHVLELQVPDQAYNNESYFVDAFRSKGLFRDDWSEGWDYRLGIVTSASSNLETDEFVFSKFRRIDRNAYYNKAVAGGILSLTGNVDFKKDFKNINDSDGMYLADTSLSGRMVGDITMVPKSAVLCRDRIFGVDCDYGEYQNGVWSETNKSTSQLFFSTIGEFGGNHRLLAASTLQRNVPNIGKVVAVTDVAMVQGLDSAIQPNRNNVLVLGEDGYVFYDLRDNDPAGWIPITYQGDCCVSRKSIANHNGVAFYAGNDGVYMFEGQKQTEITRLGSSSIKRLWKSIAKSAKQLAVGCYHCEKRQYWLAVNIGSDLNIFVFDFYYGEIFRWSLEESAQVDAQTSFYYVDGVMYLSAYDYFEDTGWFLLKYDETADEDVVSGTTPISASLLLNNVKVSDKYARLDHVSIGYSSSVSGTVEGMVDNVNLGSKTLSSSLKYVEIKSNPEVNAVGRRFSSVVSFGGGLPEVVDINLKVADIPQMRLLKNSEVFQ